MEIDSEFREAIKQAKQAFRRAEKLLKRLECRCHVEVREKSKLEATDNPNIFYGQRISMRLKLHDCELRVVEYDPASNQPIANEFGHVRSTKCVDLFASDMMTALAKLPQLLEQAVNESAAIARHMQMQTHYLNEQLDDFENSPVVQELIG